MSGHPDLGRMGHFGCGGGLVSHKGEAYFGGAGFAHAAYDD